MRGFLQPAHRSNPTESQTHFRGFTRGRRAKLAKAAQTTLVKADQWGRGDTVPSDVAEALEAAVKGLVAKGTKKG